MVTHSFTCKQAIPAFALQLQSVTAIWLVLILLMKLVVKFSDQESIVHNNCCRPKLCHQSHHVRFLGDSLSVCLVLSVCLSVCNIGVLWPNGLTDQDETWLAGRLWPWPHCVRWGPVPHALNGRSHHPIFGPYLLWPNGWMD